MSEKWKLGARHLYLVPGDSPLGLRLPLNSLPWIPPLAHPQIVPDDPFRERGKLPRSQGVPRRSIGAVGDNPYRQPFPLSHDIEGAVRCALRSRSSTATASSACSCRRSAALEDYLEMLTVVEATAVELDMPVHVEGYPPPPDYRLA